MNENNFDIPQIKDFEQFVNENYTSGVEGYSTNMGLAKRNTLPNIDNHDDFVLDLQTNGHTIRAEHVKTDILIPTQSDFNQEKIDYFKRSTKVVYKKPILVSNDNFIVDGHHRWKALDETDGIVKISRVSMNYKDLEKFLRNKSYVVKKEIHESEDE